MLYNIYETSTAFVSISKPTKEFSVGRGVKQGDPISPKLFAAVLEMAMSKIEWSERGIKINEQRLSNLWFADDIVFLTKDTDELQPLIKDLVENVEK